MADMIECVARAIAEADQEDYMEDFQRFDKRARAAIEAMREPTEAMIEEGASTRCTIQIGRQAMSGAIGSWPAKDCWRYMIDAALSNGERDG